MDRRDLKAITNRTAFNNYGAGYVNVWGKRLPITDKGLLKDAAVLSRDAVKVRQCHVLSPRRHCHERQAYNQPRWLHHRLAILREGWDSRLTPHSNYKYTA